MATSAFRIPPQAPPLFTGTIESIPKDTKRLIEHSRGVIDRMVQNVSPKSATFKDSQLQLAQDDNEMALEYHILGFYSMVSTDKALRDASTEAEKEFENFAIEASMREDIFQVIDAVYKFGESLDPESQRLLEKEHKSYINNGLNIPAGPKRARFKEIKTKLSDIAITFSKNLRDNKAGLWFTPEELEGVPTDVTSNWKKGEGENEGKLFMTFQYTDIFPTLNYAKSSATRQKVFISNENKCNQNVALFREVIILRDEAARSRGYPNHATFRLEDKMAKTPKIADDFLSDLKTRLVPGGKKELEGLKKLKKSDLSNQRSGSADNDRYYLWDHRFYDHLMLEKDYQLDQEKISEYFPLQKSIRGMMQIFETLFGLQFFEITGADRDKLAPSGQGSDLVWHEDVQVFAVWDDEAEGGEFVGYLYLDLHPRDGKYGHAAMFRIQPGFIDRNGKRRYPAAALVCNFSKPTPKKPSLLKHEEVVTLFHELGHGIHDLVSRTTYSRFHGTSTVQDFVEAPSQMLENWCWTTSQLRALSHHYSYLSAPYKDAWQQSAGADTKQPPVTMPDDLINSIIRTKHVNSALANLRQLHIGTYDMRVHEPQTHEDTEKMQYSEVWNQMRHDITPLDGPEVLGEGYGWGNGEAIFDHLMGGYDAGYYGYLFSLVYSTDMFHTVFAKDPMDPKAGRRYRHTVLEKGGSQDEMETLRQFLGREPSIEPFYKELGLA